MCHKTYRGEENKRTMGLRKNVLDRGKRISSDGLHSNKRQRVIKILNDAKMGKNATSIPLHLSERQNRRMILCVFLGFIPAMTMQAYRRRRKEITRRIYFVFRLPT